MVTLLTGREAQFPVQAREIPSMDPNVPTKHLRAFGGCDIQRRKCARMAAVGTGWTGVVDLYTLINHYIQSDPFAYVWTIRKDPQVALFKVSFVLCSALLL